MKIKKKNHVCTFCEKAFENKRHCEIHIMSTHENRKDFECSLCQKPFFDVHNLKRHFSTKHENFFQKCLKCKVVFSDKCLYEDHDCKNNKFSCDFCDKTFSQNYSRNLHTRSVHMKLINDGQIVPMNKENLSCNICGKIFQLEDDLRKHCMDYHITKRFNATFVREDLWGKLSLICITNQFMKT